MLWLENKPYGVVASILGVKTVFESCRAETLWMPSGVSQLFKNSSDGNSYIKTQTRSLPWDFEAQRGVVCSRPVRPLEKGECFQLMFSSRTRVLS